MIGKEGPARIQDSTAAPDGSQTLILDDNTGHEGGFGLPAWFAAEMKRQAFVTPATPKSSVPDIEQEVWLMKATTRIVLPHFRETRKALRPAVLVARSRHQPAQHQGQRRRVWCRASTAPAAWPAPATPTPCWANCCATLKEQGLDKTTDVFVTADHGFTTVSHVSATSPSAPSRSRRAAGGSAFGFLAMDLAATLGLPLRAPGDTGAPRRFQQWRQAAGRLRHAGCDPAPSRCGGGRQWRHRSDLHPRHDRQGYDRGQGNRRQTSCNSCSPRTMSAVSS